MELSIEEKAKRYDEAIKKAEALYKKAEPMSGCNVILETIFHELAESEDERIRKAIITYLKQRRDRSSSIPAAISSWIAWLERQGKKQQNTLIWKHWKDGIAGNGEGNPIYLTKDGYTYRLSSLLSFECDYIELSELDKLLSEKQGEQKPVWSEEDEKNINFLCELLTDLQVKSTENEIKHGTNSCSEHYYNIKKWLKSLKERVQPQPKQEWSEEDGDYINDLIEYFSQNERLKNTKEDILIWLKSLKDKYTWKPSDEQIEALTWALSLAKNCGEECAFDLRTLQDQLKKLRGNKL